MIPQQNFDSYPVFGDNSTKIKPDDAKYAAGFAQSDVLPFEWMNWAWAHNTKGITDLNTGLSSVENELNNVVQEGGGTPSATNNSQVATAIKALITNISGSLTSLATSVKTNLVAAINSHVNNKSNPHEVSGDQLTGAVPTDKIEDSAITAEKLEDGSVSLEKINESAFDSAPTPSSQKMLKSGVIYSAIAATGSLLPIGTVLPYGGATEPEGFLICDGRALSRSTYQSLFSVIGTLYGDGDGTTTFNIPDLRECVPVGAGQNTTASIVSHDVYELGQFKDDQLQGHFHSSSKSIGTFPRVRGVTGIENLTLQLNNADGQGPIDSFTARYVSDKTNGAPRVSTTTHGKQIGINYIIKY